jgi:signal transduction histidine kinase
MKQQRRTQVFIHTIQTLPLSWLNISLSKRLLLVALSYVVGIAGLWLLFPRTHNGASMFLPIVCACWLFRYRGMLASQVLNGVAFQITYVMLLRGLLPDQAFVEGGITGFTTSLVLGLVVCWLRSAVDLMYQARQQALSAEQERLVAQKAEAAMAEAYERERTLNIMKDQLVLMINHELRTPLTAVQGYLELLTNFGDRLSSTAMSEYLRKANVCCQDLTDLLEATLEAAQMGQNIKAPQWLPIRLREQILYVIESIDPQGRWSSRFQVQVSSDLIIWADQQYLRQIIRNFLSNAIKYSSAAQPIIIGASHDEGEQKSWITLWVQDFGQGISPEEIPLLFGMFVRLKHELGGTIRGLGLGLYISKQLVNTMGGQIGVESSGVEGEGSRFFVTLPAEAPAHVEVGLRGNERIPATLPNKSCR